MSLNSSTSEEDSLGLLSEEQLESSWCELISERELNNSQDLKSPVEKEFSYIIEKENEYKDCSVLERKFESIKNEELIKNFQNLSIKYNVLESTPKIKQQEKIDPKEALNKTVKIRSICSDFQDKISGNVGNEYNENSLNKTFDKSNLLNITLPNIDIYSNVSNEHLNVKEQNVCNKTFTEDVRSETTDEDTSSLEMSACIVRKIKKKEIKKTPKIKHYSSWTTLDPTSSSCMDSSTTYPQSSTEESTSIQTGTKSKIFKPDIRKKKFTKTSKKEKNMSKPRNILSISNCDPNFSAPSAIDDNKLKIQSNPTFSLASPFSTTKGTDDIKKTGFLWIPIDNTASKKIPPKNPPLNLSFKKLPKEEMTEEEKKQKFVREISIKNEPFLKKLDKKVRSQPGQYDHKLFSYTNLQLIKRIRCTREPAEVTTIRLVEEPQNLKEITRGRGRSSCIPRASRLPMPKREPRPLLKSEGKNIGAKPTPHARNPAERKSIGAKPTPHARNPDETSRLQPFPAENLSNFPVRASRLPPFPAENLSNFPARGRSSIPKKTKHQKPPEC